jgi:Lrp/AsnC family transcriptional regulator
MSKKLDAIDRRLLALLQENAETPLATLAEAVNLSTSPCWRRVQALREHGYIKRHVALADRDEDRDTEVELVAVKAGRHDPAWNEEFREAVRQIPEVLEFYRMSGAMDYLLRIVVPDIAAYDAVYQRLIRTVALFDVSSSFAMEEIKCTTALPLDYAG